MTTQGWIYSTVISAGLWALLFLAGFAVWSAVT